MKAFIFKLQRVLDLRVSREREAQRILAAIQRTVSRLETTLQETEVARKQASTDLKSGMVGVLSIDDLRLHAALGQQHARRARQILIELAAIQPQFDEARATLIKATSNRRGMEFLRDRAYREWRRECKRTERREEAEWSNRGASVA